MSATSSMDSSTGAGRPPARTAARKSSQPAGTGAALARMANSSAGTVMLGSPPGSSSAARTTNTCCSAVCAHLLHHGQQHVGSDDHARLQVVELVLQLVRLVQRAAGDETMAPIFWMP